MPKSGIGPLAKSLQRAFAEPIEQINRDVGLVRRRRRFTPLTLAGSFLTALIGRPEATDHHVAEAAEAFGVSVSHQAVTQRYTDKLAEFFEAFFPVSAVAAVKLRGEAITPILRRFTDVEVIDSSVVALPGSSPDAADRPGMTAAKPR